MSLWGNLDTVSGNQKPLFANTSNVQSNSTIHGTAANTDTYYGMVMGVSAGEEANSVGKPQHPTHAGWVSVKYGTGPIVSINIANGGVGINSNGYTGFTNSSSINVRTNGANITWPNLQVTLGGRAGRIKTEVLVAMGSISGDDPRDNVLFTGI